jgi:hypothetical protein
MNLQKRTKDVNALTLDDLYDLWERSRRNVGLSHSHIKAARQLVSSIRGAGWSWLAEALNDNRRKWFVAAFFKSYPVPRHLLKQMLLAGVLEKDPSYNRNFIQPCVQTFGPETVLIQHLEYLESGTDEEKAGAASAFYWVRGESDSTSDLKLGIRCQMLREFVHNSDVEVQRRIIPLLDLEARKYPSDLRPLTKQAIDIARSHPDEYIRHRVEIQLGACGPLMPIPHEE